MSSSLATEEEEVPNIKIGMPIDTDPNEENYEYYVFY